MIDSTYDATPEVEELRTTRYQILDQFRHESYPDDVKAILFSKDIGLEQVWVRLMFAHEKEFYGVLLNEPYTDFGCHEGTIIGLAVTLIKDKPILLFTGRTAEAVEQ